MANPQAFFVVGHRHWGKSSTLKALTGGVPQVRYWSAGARRFFIRRMSNDDRPAEWRSFINHLAPGKRSHVIVAACPVPQDLALIGNRLGGRFNLYFWIIRQSCPDPSLTISAAEEQSMRALGTVDVFAGRGNPKVMAAAFEQFVLANP